MGLALPKCSVVANSEPSFLDSEASHQLDNFVRVEIADSAVAPAAELPKLGVSTIAATIEANFTTFLILSQYCLSIIYLLK